jgi:glucose-1-phosphate cytidylyltransferase
MKVAILAGGLGTRLSEETMIKPKPMVEIGFQPILWHIMKIYSAYGFNEFVIALGYKGEIIKDYFIKYHYYRHNLTLDLASGNITVFDGEPENWRVTLLDTGLSTQTGGRIRQLAQFIGNEPFMLTYGDGLTNLNILSLLEFHKRHGKKATVTAVRPPARFGELSLKDNGEVEYFKEKPSLGEGWVNGGFFVLEPGIMDYIKDDETIWEQAPMEHLAQDGQLRAYCYNDFWHSMDTLRDVRYLNDLWNEQKAPWKIW